ncbi:MAG: ATP-binding cassette domain-containing protein, partial [Bacilli bacterium]|nr:ATP-binding cassette domain-containing protein [Bacilli bacterium]
MLEIKELTKNYQRTVLDRVSFDIKKGEICGLFGANGAGKSTLLKIITGLEKATAGEV